MSAERQQKHLPDETGKGAGSSSRISALQSPEKHGASYGSVPDITSSGIYKVEDDRQVMTSQTERQGNTEGEAAIKESLDEDGEKKITSLWSLQPKAPSTSSVEIESESPSTVELDPSRKEDNHQENGNLESGTALQFKMDRLVEHISLAATLNKDEDVVRDMSEKCYIVEDFDAIEVLMNEKPVMTSTPNNSLSDSLFRNSEESTATTPGTNIKTTDTLTIDNGTEHISATSMADIWADAEDQTVEGFAAEARDGKDGTLDADEIHSIGIGGYSRRTSDASLLDGADGSYPKHKHRPMHAKIQRRLSREFAGELEHALESLASVNPDQIACESEQTVEKSYSKNGIPSVDFTTGISNVSLSDFSERNIHNNRPMHTKITHEGNQHTEQISSKGNQDGDLSNVKPAETLANSYDRDAASTTTPSITYTDAKDNSADGPEAGTSNGEGETLDFCSTDAEGFAKGKSGTLASNLDESSHHHHKLRPKHGAIQRRLSLCGLEHLRDNDKADLQDEDVSSSTGQDLMKSDSAVKFNDTVMVNIFSSSDSKSLSSATVLNDAAEEAAMGKNQDQSSDSAFAAPTLAKPVFVSYVRRDSAVKLSKPADIIKKKQKKQAEAMLYQDKSSKLTQGNKPQGNPYDLEDNGTEPTAEHCSKNSPDAYSNLQWTTVKDSGSTSSRNDWGKEQLLVGPSSSSLEGEFKSCLDVDFNNPLTLLEHLRDKDDDSQSHHRLMNGNGQDRGVTSGQSTESMGQGHKISSQLFQPKIEKDSVETERNKSMHPTVINAHSTDERPSVVGKPGHVSQYRPVVERKREESSETIYPTSSALFRTRRDQEITKTNILSPGYAGLDHTIPSDLVLKRKKKESIRDDTDFRYPTSSELFHKKLDQELADAKLKSSGQEEVDPEGWLGAKSGIDHTTPSKLLRKYQDREATSSQPNSSGYTALDHTTPSRLFQKWLNYKRKNRTKQQQKAAVSSKPLLERKHKNSDDTIYPTSSKLYQKRADRERTLSNSRSPPGYKEFDQSKSSVVKTERNKEEGYEQMHPTSSRLFQKRADREVTDRNSKSPGYGHLDHATPSELFQRSENNEDKADLHLTSSKLFWKRVDIEKSNLKSPEYKEVGPPSLKLLCAADLENTTPSKLFSKCEGTNKATALQESRGYKELHHNYPSEVLMKNPDQQVSHVQQKSSKSSKKFTISRRGSRPELFTKNAVKDSSSKETSKTMATGYCDTMAKSSQKNKPYTVRSARGQVSTCSSSDKKGVYTTPSRLMQKREDTETTSENPNTPGYAKFLDGTTPSMLLKNVEQEPNRKESADQFKRRGSYTHGKMDSGKTRITSSPDWTLSDSGNWTLPTPSNLTMDQLNSDPSSPGPLHMASEISQGTCVSEKTPQQQENFNNWRTLSDITTYYIELSEYVSKMAKKMRMHSTSEPHFIGMQDPTCSVSTQRSEDGYQTHSYDSRMTDNESDEEIIEPGRIQGPGASEGQNVPSNKIAQSNEPQSDTSGGSITDHASFNDADSQYVWNSHPNFSGKTISDSSAYPLSSSEEVTVKPLCRKSSINSSFTAYSDSSSTDDEDHTGSSTDTESKKMLPEDSCGLNTKDMKSSLASLLSLYFTNRAPSSSLFDFCTDSTSSEASMAPPTGTNHMQGQGRYEGTQKKRNLPNMRSATPDGRGMMMEKEMMESQNRKLQMEISTLQTENKLIKDKYNRATAKINHLEEQLAESREQLESLHGNLNQELSEVQRRNKSQAMEEIDLYQTKVSTLTKENQSLKTEVSSLEKQLESAHKNLDRALLNSEKTKTLNAQNLEITTLKDEVNRVKSLLEQSERHLQEEDSRTKGLSQQVIKLTEMKNLLQQQIEMGGGGATATDKQIKSLEKRLRVTEERLHHERADRANNLSQVEDKLLTENARLQAMEKELSRQLHREKDKNRNLENKIKDTREDNERLRLSLPFDEAALTTQKGYDIPYGVHESQRQETVKKDYRQILSQLETEAGLKAGQEREMICQLWNTRQQTYNRLRQLEINLQALNLRDNNVAEGLKNLRDVKSHADAQVRQLHEQLEDSKSEKETQETTYKEQLALLVKERHDAFAQLKTAEDLMEAIRSENEILKSGLSGGGTASLGASLTLATNSRVEALQVQVKDLENQIQQMTRTTRLLEGELSTLRIQLEARDKALEDTKSELDIAHLHLSGDGGEDRKQEKIDKLTAQINGHQSEIKLLGDKVTSLNTEKSRLERDLEAALREVNITKAKVKETKHGEMADSKQAQILREELEERDRRLGKLTQEYDTLETELQTARQDLYAEQIQSQDYEAQIESYTLQIEQRGHILDTLSGTEKEQLAQFLILKETLDSVSQEINQKHAELKVLHLEMSKEKDRYEYMEKELITLRKDRPLGDNDQAWETSLPSHMLQIRELESERDHLKVELIEMTEALKQATEENGNLDKAMKQMEQQLLDERSAHLQTSAEKGELEQHLEEIAEEHDALSQERDESEEDIVKLETDLKDVVHKFEMETRKNHENLASKYPQVPAEALKMAAELDSLRTLMDAKHKEHEMLNNKISRQQVEMDFLNRRVELLHNENQCNRDDIARLTSEVSAKIKEGVANREMNQFLVKERARLQKENTQLNASVDKEKGIKERRRAEIADVMRKVEKTEESTKTTSREVLQKDAIIASLEAELGQTKQSCQTLEVDRSQLKGKVEHLQQDVDSKAVLASTLETRLETERRRLEEEKSEAAQKRDELMATCHELERLKHEHGLLLNNLNDEKQTVENLKESLNVNQQSCEKLKEQVYTLTMELESTQGQLTTSRDTVEALKQDKGAIYQEYDSMMRRLGEKDQKIAELQNKCDRIEQQMQQELTQQKHDLERENTSTERDLDTTKEENAVLKEELKMKEAQLSSFGRTLKELEDMNKEKMELEGQVRQMEGTVGDVDLLTQSLRKETITLQETIARQQESLSSLQLEHSSLKDKMRIQEEKLTDRVMVLEKTNGDLQNQYDGEKSYLKDSLMQTQTRVASVESSLASAIDSRDKLQMSSRMMERTLEETKERLQEETTCRKVAEQRAESLQSQLHESRKDKYLSEEKLNQMTTTLTKSEQMVKTEKDRAKRLAEQQQELEATVYTQDSSAKSKQEQIDLLQTEISKLRHILESQKQQLNAKLKKTTTELKQQIEIIEEDRIRIMQQSQLLSAEVEKARDQLAMKNKENLRLQEKILGQEDELREHTLRLRRAEDARKAEEELQSKLSSKFTAQEEELKRMKVYLSKKAEEAGDNEKSMWMDLNRLIQDMNRQLHEHMESQKSGGQDSKDRDVKQLSKYKKRVIDLESELSTEKAIHQITKSSLQALEEDNQRLRHQYHAMRRRDNVTSDKKYKSRMEAINEIIAKSQTQAQAMLAASGYYDDPQKSLHSPRTDYRGSPDNSLASDLSFSSTGPMVIPPYTGSSPTKVKAGTLSPRK
ncbi:uncharacterized protein LOC110458296 isoform X2 [Mizuhopecten yessoensis]|uniref:uncharacterized protein LOC110458296 isoform X2 n=1 Tax=Mizuhopecten yessoensis TaxID=6573 RepID=UPI000B45DF18|nr:uncharacterized protein LOC110458296 isoform X2 [Mizuhopecten yessoensis]